MTTLAGYLSHCNALRSSCEGILRDLENTQQGLGKEWKNVQPCVVHASQLLLQRVQLQDERLTVLEEKMDQVLNAVEVIASDSRLKEQRYQMDRDGTERVLEALQRGCQQLQSAIESERRATTQFREEILYPGLADVQQQIDRIASALHPTLFPTQTQRPETAYPSSLPQPSHSLPVVGVCSPVDNSDKHRGWDDSLIREMVHEMSLLRSQWQQLQLNPAFLHRVGEQRQAAAAESGKKGAFGMTHKGGGGVDCRVARWQWRGGHLSTPLLLAESPIMWSTLHVRETHTGEWLSAGATSDGSLVHPQCGDGVGPPFLWRPRHPSVIELAKGGIYRVTVCLFSTNDRPVEGRKQNNEQQQQQGHQTIASALPSVTLRINEKSVFNFFAGGTTCYTLRAPKGGGGESGRRARNAAPCRTSAPSHRQCACGTATTFTTSSFADFLRLPVGATLSVHCHNMPSTGAMHEALLELELVAY